MEDFVVQIIVEGLFNIPDFLFWWNEKSWNKNKKYKNRFWANYKIEFQSKKISIEESIILALEDIDIWENILALKSWKEYFSQDSKDRPVIAKPLQWNVLLRRDGNLIVLKDISKWWKILYYYEDSMKPYLFRAPNIFIYWLAQIATILILIFIFAIIVIIWSSYQ